MRFGRQETGLHQLLRSEKMKPNVPFVIGHVAKALLENGFESEAQERCEHMRKVVDSIKIATLVAAIEQGKESLERYGTWENPHFAHTHVMLARYLALEGRVEESTYALLLGNSRFQGYSKLMVEMGRNLISRQRPEEAMEWLSAAILLDQNCYDGFYETSFLHATKDNLRLGAQALRHAVTLRPLFPDHRFQLGTLLMDLGEIDEAITEFQRALVNRPGDGLCALHLASALVEKAQPAAAIDVIRHTDCHDWPEALVVAAQAHVALGDQNAARAIMEDLIAKEPSYAEARELIEVLSYEAG
jgi:tetratricopeptide (TPR) repeat protein